MKTRNYLILGAVVVGLTVTAFNVFSTGTDNNSDAVTESVTSNTDQSATTTNPTTTVETAPAVGSTINDVESAPVAPAKETDNNSAE